jgi:hypothetical protein
MCEVNIGIFLLRQAVCPVIKRWYQTPNESDSEIKDVETYQV